MSFSVSDFTSQLSNDGARPNLFQVFLSFPLGVAVGPNVSQELSLMAKSATLPSSRMGLVTLPYMGRQVKIPGNVTYDNWSITIINDEDFPVRNAFEVWHNLINSHAGNVRDPSMVNMSGYAVNASVLQYDKVGGIIKQYDLIGIWPVTVSPIQLDWGANDTVEQFDVEFAMQYWESLVPVQVTT